MYYGDLMEGYPRSNTSDAVTGTTGVIEGRPARSWRLGGELGSGA